MCGSPSSLWLHAFVTASVESTAYRSQSGVSDWRSITRRPDGARTVTMSTPHTGVVGNCVHP